jgi:hypothetical protein
MPIVVSQRHVLLSTCKRISYDSPLTGWNHFASHADATKHVMTVRNRTASSAYACIELVAVHGHEKTHHKQLRSVHRCCSNCKNSAVFCRFECCPLELSGASTRSSHHLQHGNCKNSDSLARSNEHAIICDKACNRKKRISGRPNWQSADLYVAVHLIGRQ